MELLNSLDTLCRKMCKTGKLVLESVQSGEIDLEEVNNGQNEQISELKQLMHNIREIALKVSATSESAPKKDEYINLLSSINKTGPLLQNFLDSIEACCLNPYDFALQQNTQLLYGKILTNFNESLNTIEKLQNNDSMKVEEVLQSTAKSAVLHIRNLAELLQNNDRSIEEFSKSARLCFEALISLKSIVLTLKAIPHELVDKFGRLTPLLIKCAKEAFMKPDDLESHKNFDLMKQGIAKFIHQFLTYSTPSLSPSSTPSSSPSISPRSGETQPDTKQLPINNNNNNNNANNSNINNNQSLNKQRVVEPSNPASSENSNSSLARTLPRQLILPKPDQYVPQNKASKSHSDLTDFANSITPQGNRVDRILQKDKDKKKKKEKASSKTINDLRDGEKKKKKREDSLISNSMHNLSSRSKSSNVAPMEKLKTSRINSLDQGRSISQSVDMDERSSRPPISKSEQIKELRRRPQSRHDLGWQIKLFSTTNLRKQDEPNDTLSPSPSTETVMHFFFSKFPSLLEDFGNSPLENQNSFKKELSNILLLCALEDSFLNSNLILSKANDAKAFDSVKKFGCTMTRLLGLSYTLSREAEVSLDTLDLEAQLRLTFCNVVDALSMIVKSGSSKISSVSTLNDVHREIVEVINKLKDDDLNVPSDDPVLLSCKKHNIGQIDGLVKQTLWYRTHSIRLLSSQLISTMMIILSSTTPITQNIIVDLNSIAICLANTLSHFFTVVKLSTETSKLKISNNFLNSSSQESMEELLDIDIWAGNEKEKEPSCATIATLNVLIEMLTSDVQYDANFMKTFICTYQSFTTPSQLLSKLKQRFFYPNSISPSRGSAIQMRVCVVLKYWVQHQFNDFDDNLVNSLFEFLENSVKKSGHPQLADIIIVQLLEKTRERQFELENKVNAAPAPLENILLSSIESIPELLFKYSPKEVAEQMTLIDMNYFKAIQPTELMKQAWNSNSLKWKAVNVNQLMDRLNSISYWLSTVILSFENVSSRVKAFEWFYDVAINLRKLNNYHSMMGFVVGFNISGITRLKHTVESVDPKLIKQFTAIEELMSPSSSFKNYRKQFNVMKLPAIPYLGVHLTDLVFIEDGNPDEIDNKINFPKRELVYKTISEIQVFQQSSYEYPVLDPINKILQILPCMSEKQLYKLSLLREPRA